MGWMVKLVFIGIFLLLIACNNTQRNNQLTIATDDFNIIGGVEVLNSDPLRKHVVLLNSYSLDKIDDPKPDIFNLCSGIVISKTHILTAAHCIPETKNQFFIMEVLFTTNISNKNYKIANATVVKVHDEYLINKNSHFDMAILKLNKEIPADYEPISILPAAVELKKGDLVLAMGYGKKFENKQDSNVNLNKVDNLKIIEDQGTKLILDQTSGRGTCNGDSGGPTLYNNQGKYYLIGINTHVKSISQDEMPTCKMHGVLIKVQTFKPWILKVMQEI